MDVGRRSSGCVCARIERDVIVEMDVPEPRHYKAMAETCREVAADARAWSHEARDHLLKVAELFERSAERLEREAV
jgi:hypothetical protein